MDNGAKSRKQNMNKKFQQVDISYRMEPNRTSGAEEYNELK